MKSIDQKLVENKYRQLRKSYLEGELVKITERLQREAETLERLKRELDKENEDVARLRQISLSRLLKAFSSREELRLEKEKAEAFRATLDYKLKQNDLEDLQYQKNLLEQELKHYDMVNSEYQSLLDLKRKMLETPILNQIRELEQELAECTAVKEATQAAWESGKKLCTSFNYLLDSLSELVEDTSDAKRLWYPTVDQEHIEDAIKEMEKLNGLWKDFEQALKYTKVTLPEHFDRNFFMNISDVGFQEEQRSAKMINTSFDQLNECYSGVRTILNQLEKQLSQIEHQQFDLQWQIQASIEMN